MPERVTALTAPAVPPADAGHRDLVARAGGVLDYAALIASDVGLPDLAAHLRRQQHRAFADAGRLASAAGPTPLQP
ncbi:hypothetical protein [Embleya sp. NPDC005971]|uniref:hypothetical protein n=1 Tax=Embleya sp. NPDC005971 TaxID=3156724 RepID=UPI0033FF2A2D